MLDADISAQVRADKARRQMRLEDLTSDELPAWKLKARMNGTTTWRASEVAAIAASLGYESTARFVEAAETAATERANHPGKERPHVADQ